MEIASMINEERRQKFRAKVLNKFSTVTKIREEATGSTVNEGFPSGTEKESILLLVGMFYSTSNLQMYLNLMIFVENLFVDMRSNVNILLY